MQVCTCHARVLRRVLERCDARFYAAFMLVHSPVGVLWLRCRKKPAWRNAGRAGYDVVQTRPRGLCSGVERVGLHLNATATNHENACEVGKHFSLQRETPQFRHCGPRGAIHRIHDQQHLAGRIVH